MNSETGSLTTLKYPYRYWRNVAEFKYRPLFRTLSFLFARNRLSAVTIPP